jgi:hypothetical protein
MLGEILLSSVMGFSAPNYVNLDKNNLKYDQDIIYFERGPLVAIKEEELNLKTKKERHFLYNPNLDSSKSKKGFISHQYNRRMNVRAGHQKQGITGAHNSLNKSKIIFEKGNSLEGFIFEKKKSRRI